jgi:hypothetical protein
MPRHEIAKARAVQVGSVASQSIPWSRTASRQRGAIGYRPFAAIHTLASLLDIHDLVGVN